MTAFPPAPTPAAPGAPHYGGRRFSSTGSDAGSVGAYFQDGDLVWAEFSGPGVRVGRLVGSLRPDGTIDAAYCFVTDTGPVSGECVSTPEVLADGRLRLTEHWRRGDGSTGVSQIEEIRR